MNLLTNTFLGEAITISIHADLVVSTIEEVACAAIIWLTLIINGAGLTVVAWERCGEICTNCGLRVALVRRAGVSILAIFGDARALTAEDRI